MVRFMKPFAFLAALALLVSAAALRADGTATAPATGSKVTGTLVDADGKAVGGASVMLIDPKVDPKKPIQTVTADDNGAYTFTDVAAGSYTVRAFSKAAKVGGKTADPITVTAGQDTKVDPITCKARKPKPAAAPAAGA